MKESLTRAGGKTLDVAKGVGWFFGISILFFGACLFIAGTGFDANKAQEKYTEKKKRKALKQEKCEKRETPIGAYS
ncbi:MAG: hypothetical protein V1865_02050 [bacterium]